MNIIAKGREDAPYILTDIMATSLTEAQFKKIQSINTDLLKDYHYIPFKDTDFSWWSRISRKLTKTRIKQAYFECSFNGTITEY